MVGWDSMPLDVELMMHESMNVLIFIFLFPSATFLV
jgi:hypothetical protein